MPTWPPLGPQLGPKIHRPFGRTYLDPFQGGRVYPPPYPPPYWTPCRPSGKKHVKTRVNRKNERFTRTPRGFNPVPILHLGGSGNASRLGFAVLGQKREPQTRTCLGFEVSAPNREPQTQMLTLVVWASRFRRKIANPSPKTSKPKHETSNPSPKASMPICEVLNPRRKTIMKLTSLLVR